jgi:alpha-galactosidase
MVKDVLPRLGAAALGFGLYLLCGPSAGAQTIAPTPPMGWSSWNHFGAKIDDKTVRAVADAMVASGLKDAGYVYVNIDDGWEGERDAAGEIRPNPKFPDMKALADYLHARGLKLGLYSSPGPKTCAGFEGSGGHEAQDARTYARWGVDYLKYDLCSLGPAMIAAGSIEGAHAIEARAYRAMRQALDAAGRPVVFSLCQYGFNQVWRWGADVGGNLWRTTGDIEDSYKRMAEIGFSQAGLAKYAGPGRWNDPDMLEVGNGGMSATEYRTHMSLWALLAAPLIAGNDPGAMSLETRAILTNKGVLAIDQDPLGRPADRVSAEGPLEIWARDLTDGARAVGLFNRSDFPARMRLNLADLGQGGRARALDVWTGRDLGLIADYAADVPAHGVVLLRLTR